MQLTMLKGKIHRAIVKQAELNYVGSITIDPKLMEAAGILEYEQVQIVDVENGNRFETYTIDGEPGSGMICLNGAAARQVQVGDHVIIMAYCQMDAKEAADRIIGDVREDGLAALIEELWFNGPRAESSGHELGSPWGQMEAAEEKQ